MWTPIRAKITNFFSYANAEIHLKDGLTVISGEMINEEEADSNGAGKSTIIEIISFALSGDTFKETSADDIIKDGKEKCIVELELDNPVLGQNLLILRTLERGASQKVILTLDGDKIKDLTSVGAAQKKINELIGVMPDDLFNFYIINDQTLNLFFSGNDAKQKEIISRIANFDSLDKLIKTVEVECSTINTELLVKTTELSNKKSKLEYLQERIITRSKEIKNETEVKKAKLLSEITTFNNTIKGHKQNLVSANEQVVIHTKALDEIKNQISNSPDFYLEVTIKSSDINSLEQTLKSQNKELSRLELMMNKKITCPKCGNEFLVGENIDLNKLQKDIDLQSSEISKTKSKIVKAEIEKVEIKKKQDGLEKLNQQKSNISTKLHIVNNEVKSLSVAIQSNQKHLAERQLELDNLIKGKSDEIENMEREIAKFQLAIELLQTDFNNVNELHTNANILLDHLGKKGFKTYLANKSIKSIEGNINMFLKKFQSKFTININGYKQLKSGELREKIEIMIFGDATGSVRKFSKGQKSRLNVCSVLALHNMINVSVPTRGLNFLAFDETFDGLDYKGQKFIMNVLRSTGIKTLLITHNKNVNLQDVNEIRVQYKNKTSYIA